MLRTLIEMATQPPPARHPETAPSLARASAPTGARAITILVLWMVLSTALAQPTLPAGTGPTLPPAMAAPADAALALRSPQPPKTELAKPLVLERVLFKADNHVLLQSDLEVALIQMRQQAEQANRKMDMSRLRCQAARQLALSKLMLAKADQDSVTVKTEEVDQELNQRMDYMVAGMGGRERVVAAYGKTIEQLKSDLRGQVRDQLLVRKMQGKITEGLKVTPAQVRRYYDRIPVDSLPVYSTQVEVAQIVRLAKPGRERRRLAREQADALRDRIVRGGEDFDILARLYSQDPGSGSQGGKILGAERGQMVPEYEAAAMALKPGETSPVTETTYGYHIIQLLDRRGNEYDSRHILIRPQVASEDKLSALASLDSIRGAILADSLKFERAAARFSDDPGTKMSGGTLLDPASGSSRLSTEALDPKLYFSLDTMQVGQVSRPMPFAADDGREGWRILYYRAKHAPHRANLRDDYQRLQAAALDERRRKAMADWVTKTRNEISITQVPDLEGCRLLDAEQFELQ